MATDRMGDDCKNGKMRHSKPPKSQGMLICTPFVYNQNG